MDRLPTEVLHLICHWLSQDEAAKARLINRTFSQVAVYYLVDTVHFHTSPSSLVRLSWLASHPVFQKTVIHVNYEASTISDVGCRHAYLEHFEVAEDHAHERPPPLSSTPTTREERLHARNMAKFRQSVLERYHDYRDKYDEQQALLTPDKMDSMVGLPISNFVNMKSFTFIPVATCSHSTSSRFWNEYGDRCTVPMTMASTVTPIQILPLFVPHGHVSAGLKAIRIESLSIKFFAQPDVKMAVAGAFTQLTCIDLSFTINYDDLEDDDSDDVALCRRILQKGILRDCLAAAQGLQRLEVEIVSYPRLESDISKEIFGTTVWPHVTHLGLGLDTMTQTTYMDLLRRFPRLDSLRIESMRLEEGTWLDTIEEMRGQLNLEHLTLPGYLWDADEMYYLDFVNMELYFDGDEIELRREIEVYVCSMDHDYDLNPLAYYDTVFGSAQSIHAEDYSPLAIIPDFMDD